MKKIAPVLFIFMLCCSCNKEEKRFMTAAVIFGSEPSTCPCCGGYKITLSDSLNPTTYYFVSNSEMLPALADRSFPIHLDVDWKFSDACGGNNIDITGYQTGNL